MVEDSFRGREGIFVNKIFLIFFFFFKLDILVHYFIFSFLQIFYGGTEYTMAFNEPRLE